MEEEQNTSSNSQITITSSSSSSEDEEFSLRDDVTNCNEMQRFQFKEARKKSSKASKKSEKKKLPAEILVRESERRRADQIKL